MPDSRARDAGRCTICGVLEDGLTVARHIKYAHRMHSFPLNALKTDTEMAAEIVIVRVAWYGKGG